MKQTLSKFGFAMALAIFTLPSNAAQSKQLDTAQIDELTGLKGKLNQQENVYKVSSPRTDLKISVDKWEMPPFMGLTSWAAFMPGAKGETKDGMFKAVFGRTVKMPCGCEVGKEMGVNTWAAFAGSDDNAVVDGDFVVLGEELQPALKSLRKSGINIVAIHHHMVGEEPRMIFFHYWGRGPAKELASAVKTALQTTKTMTPAPK